MDGVAWHREVARLSCQFRPREDNGAVVGRLADLHERIAAAEERVAQLHQNLHAVAGTLVGEDEAAQALSAFDPIWKTLTPLEQGRVIGLLVERVEYDGSAGKVTVAFRPTGIRTLADELAGHTEEAVA